MLGLALAAASAVFNGSFGVLAKLPAVQRANVSAEPFAAAGGGVASWWWVVQVVPGARACGVVVRGVGKEWVGGCSSAFGYNNSITQNAPLVTPCTLLRRMQALQLGFHPAGCWAASATLPGTPATLHDCCCAQVSPIVFNYWVAEGAACCGALALVVQPRVSAALGALPAPNMLLRQCRPPTFAHGHCPTCAPGPCRRSSLSGACCAGRCLWRPR